MQVTCVVQAIKAGPGELHLASAYWSLCLGYVMLNELFYIQVNLHHMLPISTCDIDEWLALHTLVPNLSGHCQFVLAWSHRSCITKANHP